LDSFFKDLISKIIFEYTTSVYPEGKEVINKSYKNGDSIIAVDDVNLKSYAFIYSYLERLFSEYNIVIYKQQELVKADSKSCTLGSCPLDENAVLGEAIENFKEFIVIRFITENLISHTELNLISQRLKTFKNYFHKILDKICVIIENQITDEELYSILPIELNSTSRLIQNLVRLNKTIMK